MCASNLSEKRLSSERERARQRERQSGIERGRVLRGDVSYERGTPVPYTIGVYAFGSARCWSHGEDSVRSGFLMLRDQLCTT